MRFLIWFRRFQEKSYDYMKVLIPEFSYEKYNKTGETKDIAKLYLNFFLAQHMQTKVDDLKRAYANNKFIGVIPNIFDKRLVPNCLNFNEMVGRDSPKTICRNAKRSNRLSDKLVHSPNCY
jgi:hypothetical protein